jgi:hypothetical protein
MDFEALISACYSLQSERNEILKTLTTPEEITKWQKDTLHFYRIQIEPYVFNYLNYQYANKLDTFWKTHQFPKKSKYSFVIVERRVHPNWWFVLRNIAWAAPHFSLYIFCSEFNYNFIKSLLGDKAENVHIHKLFKDVVDKDKGFNEYNITFKTPSFYKMIDSEYFINFQLDSYFIQKIPDWIFTGTYYGSPWVWNTQYGGNGGLAVRNTKKLIELCEKEINNALNGTGEDWYISEAIKKHNFELPSLEFRVKVFQENFPTEYIPIGTNQFWTYLNNYNISDTNSFKDNILKLVTLIDL